MLGCVGLVLLFESGYHISLIRMKAQTLVDSLSELMVDASLGTIQCLEEIVSTQIWIISVHDK